MSSYLLREKIGGKLKNKNMQIITQCYSVIFSSIDMIQFPSTFNAFTTSWSLYYKLKFLIFKVSFKEDKMYLKEVLTKWKFEISSLKIYTLQHP